MRKYSYVLLALLCFFGLTGCGTGSGESGSAKGAEGAGNTENKTVDARDALGDSDKRKNVPATAGKNSGEEERNGTGDGSSAKGENGTGDGSGPEERGGTDLTGGETTQRLRIVDGAESGNLVLAGEGAGQVYTLSLNGAAEVPVFLDGQPAQADALEDGMMVEVSFDGTVLESYPSQFGEVYSLSGYSLGTVQNPGGSHYDLCGLYLQVLDDLWNRDPGLNSNISYVSVDLSEAPGGLTAGEREAIAWIFGCAHQAESLSLTLEELAEQGYLKEALPGSENTLYEWEDGVLFCIDSGEWEEGEIYSLPALKFNARKWRSPRGAYFFEDCWAVWPEMGTWSGYEIGDEAIS